MSSTTTHLSIAVVGAGRIGSSYAYQLARAGHDVTLVARPGSARLSQLERDGGVVLTSGARAELAVADHLEVGRPFDLVVVTTLAHQVDALLPVLEESRARSIHFMFVTPEAARLGAAVGAGRASFGMAGVLATLDPAGKLDLTVGKTKSIQGDQRWVELFEAAGMPAKLEADAGRWLRTQTPLTIAMESVAGAGIGHRRGSTWSEAKLGAEGLRAGFSLLRVLGDDPYPTAKDRMGRAPRPVLTLVLWAISRSKYRATVGNSAEECRGLVDLLVAEARRAGPAASAHADAVAALRPRQPARVRVG